MVRQSAAEFLKERIGENRMNRIKDMEELKQLCNPVIEYLKENCDSCTEVHITDSEIKVISIKYGIPLNDTGVLDKATPQSFLPQNSDKKCDRLEKTKNP